MEEGISDAANCSMTDGRCNMKNQYVIWEYTPIDSFRFVRRVSCSR